MLWVFYRGTDESRNNNKHISQNADDKNELKLAADKNPPSKMYNDTMDSAEVRREAVLMGSQFIFIVDATKTKALLAITAATETIAELNKQVSSWKPGSDISLLNENAGIRKTKIGQHALHLLQLAKDISVETENSFDITIAPVWELWPFQDLNTVIPNKQQIQEKLSLVNSQKIIIDKINSTAFLPQKGMKISLEQ